MEFPTDLKYSEEHEWVKVEEGNIAIVGITDYAQSQLGELVYVEVDTLDETLDKDEVFGTVEAVKTTSDLYMPVSGKVIEFNAELDDSEGDNPTLINESPYEAGWIVRIEMSDPSELEALMDAEAYQGLVS